MNFLDEYHVQLSLQCRWSS